MKFKKRSNDSENWDLKTDFDNESATLGVCVLSPNGYRTRESSSTSESFKTCVKIPTKIWKIKSKMVRKEFHV